jgi:hypothetical protein
MRARAKKLLLRRLESSWSLSLAMIAVLTRATVTTLSNFHVSSVFDFVMIGSTSLPAYQAGYFGY